MKGDLELLVLAGKAFGITNSLPEWLDWNPLRDDGESFRLMVELGITVEFDGSYVNANQICVELPKKSTAMRFAIARRTSRAIVMAAAEIGRAMP